MVGLSARHYTAPAGPARRVSADAPVEAALRAAIARHPGWGFWKYHHYLRQQATTTTTTTTTAATATATATTTAAAATATATTVCVNHKRLWRIYQTAGLQLPRRRRVRLPARVHQPLTVPTQPGVCWSMDFTSDALRDGRRLRTFNVVDDFHRAALVLDIDFPLPAERVIRTLTELVARHGCPQRLRCDNGPEFISRKLRDWCVDHEVELHWIEPGKPTRNAYIERFNGSYRRELLDAYVFTTLRQVRELSQQWQHDYNYLRPHQALQNLPPMTFLAHKTSTNR